MPYFKIIVTNLFVVDVLYNDKLLCYLENVLMGIVSNGGKTWKNMKQWQTAYMPYNPEKNKYNKGRPIYRKLETYTF